MPMNVSNKAVKAKRRRSSRYNAVIFSVGAVAITSALIAMTQLGTPWSLYGSAAVEPQASNPKDAHSGTIVRQFGDAQCAVAAFDNDTGRTTEATACKGAVLDARGVPVPTNTIHRLESISKSFSGGAR
jgi:hypothetical protein